ncbi:MAG: transcriptional regulator [Nitrosomonas sp.]|nr:MAG: transcriptional regulator [Nitrosomonas sp.]
MINHQIIALFFLFAFGFKAAVAQDFPPSSESALAWLKKIADAPHQLNYSGTFVYYADGHIEASNVIHKIDQLGEHEKIEVLDGTPRIVFRNNDEMKCYLPDTKKIYNEKRWFRKFFPNLLPQSSNSVNDNYYVKELKRERVASHESQVLLLMPRDLFRYGQQFWVDTQTGLLLKAAVVNGDNIIEQFAFVQLDINNEIHSDLLKPDLSLQAQNWQVIDLVSSVLKEGELKWQIRSLPSGFKKLIEMRRNLIDKSTLIDHIALSDGVATVSIFIEPLVKDAPAPVPGFFTSRGAINIYVRILGDNKITAVGEVPLKTIKLIGDSVFKQE